MGLYFTIREKLRSNPTINKTIYLTQSLYRSHFGRLVGDLRRARKTASAPQGVALCLRFRDEARYLAEWLEYYLAAGISHFFLYNNFSADDYTSVIQPWTDTGQVTLIDWAKVPASPAAEEDCIRRALGRFRWVGFLDADEFVVIRDGSSIGEFLEGFPRAPGVALHWRFFGSSMHRVRPAEPIILAYQHRAPNPNRHIKTFVRPGTRRPVPQLALLVLQSHRTGRGGTWQSHLRKPQHETNRGLRLDQSLLFQKRRRLSGKSRAGIHPRPRRDEFSKPSQRVA